VRYQRGSTGRAGRISNANFLVALWRIRNPLW
jgi:hypothetical protein